MTRIYNHPYLVTAVAVGIMLSCALVSYASIANAQPPAQSCATPAMTFATLVTCRTQTAAASRGTPTQQATVTRTPGPTVAQATPTRFATASYPECEIHVRGGPTYRVPGFCDSMSFWTVQIVPTAWNRATAIPETRP